MDRTRTARDDERPRLVRLRRAGPVEGTVTVPGSKSMTNRALVIAALAEGVSEITGGLVGDDSTAMVNGLRALGIETREGAAGEWSVSGSAGFVPARRAEIDADMAGTALRFLTAVAALGPGEVVITGRPQLMSRPLGPLLEALRACGADVEGSGPAGDHGPVTIRARRRRLGGEVSMDASQSSQFVTALLLVAPYFDSGLVLETPGLGAAGFVDLTLMAMERASVKVEVEVGASGPRYSVPGGLVYAARPYEVPPDASAASHLVTLAAATGGTVTIPRLVLAGSQPDYGLLDVLEAAGATVRRGDGDGASVTVQGPERLRPLDVDLSSMPDQLPNVAVVAALANGRSRIEGVGVTRFHETDRMSAVEAELAKAGVRTELEADAVVVHGGSASGVCRFSAHHDHRMAMAFTALAAALGEGAIEGAQAVSKTYPGFFEDVTALGVDCTLA